MIYVGHETRLSQPALARISDASMCTTSAAAAWAQRKPSSSVWHTHFARLLPARFKLRHNAARASVAASPARRREDGRRAPSFRLIITSSITPSATATMRVKRRETTSMSWCSSSVGRLPPGLDRPVEVLFKSDTVDGDPPVPPRASVTLEPTPRPSARVTDSAR